MTGWRKRQVLEMAEKSSPSKQDWWKDDDALEAFAALVREDALAQPAPVQKPVAWLLYKSNHKESFWLDKGDAYNLKLTPEHRWEPLYTTPPQRTWVGLTDEEMSFLFPHGKSAWVQETVKIIEAKLKEKNT